MGERGYRLSGAQRQRLNLARAILRDPQLLILDEATSALDSQSERLVQEAIEPFERNHTVLVIAERLSTIVKADQILVLESRQRRATGKPQQPALGGGGSISSCGSSRPWITDIRLLLANENGPTPAFGRSAYP